MSFSKKQKTLVYIFSGIIAIIIIGIVVINLLVGNIIGTKIKNSLNKEDNPNYSIELRKTNFNLLTGNINLKDLKITPDSVFLESLKKEEGEETMGIEINIPTFRLGGINLYDAITKKDIKIDKIQFIDANLKLYVGHKSPEKSDEKQEEKRFNIDSIYMAGLDGLSIGKIEFTKCSFELHDIVNNKVILQNEDLKTEIKDFYLQELEGGDDYFSLNLDNLKLELKDQRFSVPGGNYYISIKRVYFSLADLILEIDKLSFKPTYEDKYELAKKLKFTSEIYDITVDQIKISSFDLVKMINDGIFIIDTVNIDGINLSILMDKRLPFNTDKRPKLPYQSIKQLRFPLYVGSIKINDSYLKYQERMESGAEPMTAILGDLNIQVHFVTSIKDSLKTKKSMTVNLQSKFMEKTAMHVNFDFPIYSTIDTFYFTGHMASAKMNEFNRASFPAMGLKFEKGKLNEINFSGSANNKYSSGTMTMLYSELQADISKKDLERKNKFLSWAANTVTHVSNPGKNNKVRIARMEFERVNYKGFGNYVWKTLLSGIMNTILPTGKTVKEDAHTKAHQKVSHESIEQEKESKKEERVKRRKERKDKK